MGYTGPCGGYAAGEFFKHQAAGAPSVAGEVITVNGRTLAVEEWGVPDGTPVRYAHGTPMSRLARYPDDRLFAELGVRLVTYDRPGFGNSTPDTGRRVVDAAGDIAAIADALGLDRILDEAQATGGDIRALVDLFGLSITGADRYAVVLTPQAVPPAP